MSKRIREAGAVLVALLVATGVAFAAASYPTSVKSFPTRVTGEVITATLFNDPQDEITAIEQGLLNGFQHALRPDTTANNRDLGLSTAQWRDLYLGTSVRVGTNPAATGAIRLTNNTNVTWRNAANTGDVTGWQVNASDLLVTPATSISIGATPALGGAIRVPAGTLGQLVARNNTNNANIPLINLDVSDRIHLAADGQDIRWGTATVVLGGGATATLGTIGGSGPATAAQFAWVRVIDSTGTAGWMALWR